MSATIRDKNIEEYKQLYVSDGSANSYEVRVKVDILKKYIKDLKKNSQVLEIGYGTGDLLHLMSRKYSHSQFTGLEVVLEAKKLYKKRYPYDKNVRLVTGDAEKKIKLPSNSFDLILASHLLEHLENEDGFLKEVNRLLKKNGVFLLAVPEWGDFDNHLHYRQYNKNELKKLGKKYKWKVTSINGDGFILNKLYYFLVNLLLIPLPKNQNTHAIEFNTTKSNKLMSTVIIVYYKYFVGFLLNINRMDTFLFSNIDNKPMQWIAIYKK